MTPKKMEEIINEITDVITKFYKTPISNIDIREDIAIFTNKKITSAIVQIGNWEVKLTKSEDIPNEEV